ncbi:P-selectin-like [Watersipora subatra]|uniref:P-selectin-like n=1 Tax=Watersipora subatra TaxID=2589382 RepID=UPI00355BB3AF
MIAVNIHVVDCGPPPLVQNSQKNTSESVYFANTNYTCDVGYEMSGESNIVCQKTGSWTSPPKCREANCGAPPNIQSAAMQVSGYKFNDTACYTCQAGYEIDGIESTVCQLIGFWSVPPSCKAIFCQRPQTPQHSQLVSLAGTIFGQTAVYECLPGYTIDGPKYIICQLNGEWSPAPNCTLHEEDFKAISCQMPQTPNHSRLVSITGLKVDETAVFECLPGYITNGSKYIVCQLSGE